ncbi:MAG: hypothetical protein AAGB05_09095 [Pseudomonadota bacterium]
MSGLVIAGLTGLSLAGLGYMAVTDPKRRRVFRQPPLTGRRWLWPARVAVFAPAAVLVALGHWSGLMIWAGAVSVLGWAMAAVRPDGYALAATNAHAALYGALIQLQQTLGALRPTLALVGERADRVLARLRKALPSRSAAPTADVTSHTAVIAALELRICELEAQVAALTASAASHDHHPSAQRRPPLPDVPPQEAAE